MGYAMDYGTSLAVLTVLSLLIFPMVCLVFLNITSYKESRIRVKKDNNNNETICKNSIDNLD